MAIRQSKYIDITSGVGGASAVKNREFIARCFTTNDKVGIGHVLEFSGIDAVLDYFGSDSKEYGFAVKYFGFTAKNITKAKKISFARWANATSPAYILGLSRFETDVATYLASNSKISFTVGQEDILVDGIEFPEQNEERPLDMAAICTSIQTKMRENSKLSAATVETTNDGRIKITLGSVSGEVKACKPLAESGDLATLLGLVNSPICSNSSAQEAPVNGVVRSAAISDNFGTIAFIGYTPSVEEIKAIADWNAAQNFRFEYAQGVKAYTMPDGTLNDVGGIINIAETVGKIEGTSLWAFKEDSDFIEALPAAILATTDYSRTNSTKTFMYQQGNFTPAITSDMSANVLDALNVNYVGQTQFAGGLLDFTQDGNNLDGTEISVYCNEMWLKASFWAAIMNLFIAVEKVPANDEGLLMIRTVMMDTINTAVRNGTISKMKPLTTNQKIYITSVTGNEKAWESVYTDGFTLNIAIEQGDDGKYIAKYILVYSKGDAIRKVEGSDILI